ncbi:hypothetical protein L3X38_003999 [Prunus dulcis]|uniref:Uncharacterized protein n=1 Tax=Prunus dulcis TaxID=3755 RepID=A0AAD5F2T9_PRUDU|nr:hypothetical protein L3X38_003999 [Prunus dulcis]
MSICLRLRPHTNVHSSLGAQSNIYARLGQQGSIHSRLGPQGDQLRSSPCRDSEGRHSPTRIRRTNSKSPVAKDSSQAQSSNTPRRQANQREQTPLADKEVDQRR